MPKLQYIQHTPSQPETSIHPTNPLTCQNLNTYTKPPHMPNLQYIHQTPSHAKTSVHPPNPLTCQNFSTSTKPPHMPKPQPVYHTSYNPKRQSVYPVAHKTPCSLSIIISIPSGLACHFSLSTKPHHIAKTSVCLPMLHTNVTQSWLYTPSGLTCQT